MSLQGGVEGGHANSRFNDGRVWALSTVGLTTSLKKKGAQKEIKPFDHSKMKQTMFLRKPTSNCFNVLDNKHTMKQGGAHSRTLAY